MRKRPTRSHRACGHADAVLLPPRLQPLSHEERAEAVALLAELLLAAAGWTDEGRGALAAVVERREGGRAA